MLSVREIFEVSCVDADDFIVLSMFDQVFTEADPSSAGHILIEMLKYFRFKVWCPLDWSP